MGIRRRIRLQLQQVPSIVRNAVRSNSRLLINALLGFALFGMCPPLFATWTVPSTHSWGGSGTDYGNSVAIDSSGNTYVAGATNSSLGSNDALVLKYDSTGAFAWARTWGGFSDDYATAVGVGPDGYVYVTGGTASYGAGWYDCFLLKLDTSGNLIWNRTWGGPSYDVGHDLAFDSQGNIYVAAETYSASTAAVLLKFDPSGNLLLTRTWKGPATYDSAYSIDLDSNGNILLAGISWDYSVSPGHNRILLIKFDPKGNLLWSENWQGPGEDEAWGPKVIRADASGNVYVLGRTTSFGAGGWDLLLLKLDPSGNLLWSSTWGGPGAEGAAQLSGIGGIGFSPAGNIIVTSSSNSFLGGAYGAVLLQYTPTGAFISSQIFAGASDVLGQGFVLDPSGNVIVAGEAQNAAGTWQSVSGTVNTAAGTFLSPGSIVSSPGESVGNPTIALDSPVGVQDSGGGLGDVFVSSAGASDSSACFSSLPKPILTFTGQRDYIDAGGTAYTAYNLSVANSSAFPDVLFSAAPNLPPCGLNSSASRTWVNEYDVNGSYLYGFCGLHASSDLNSLWFGLPKSQLPPSSVYITLVDRQCEITYTSTLAQIPSQVPPLPPVISSVQPNVLVQGSVTNLIVNGTGFRSDDSVGFSTLDLKAESISLNSQGQLSASVTVSANAGLGCHDVIVTAPAGQSSTLPCGVLVVSSRPPAPESLQIVVGANQVYLRWAPVITIPSITSYLISVDSFDAQSQRFISYGSVTVPPNQSSILLSTLDGGYQIQNGTLYAFKVSAISTGVNSDSTQPVFGMPSSFQVSSCVGSNGCSVLLPQHPVLLLHGITSTQQGAQDYWNDAKTYFQNSLGWTYGGVLTANRDRTPPAATLSGSNATGVADFYTAVFSEILADPDGIEGQGDEVNAFIEQLHSNLQFPSVSLLAHSMGGLASRVYLQRPDKFPAASSQVSDLITYGSPHLGVLTSDLLDQINYLTNLQIRGANSADASISYDGWRAGQVLAQVSNEGVTEQLLRSEGMAEMTASCVPSSPQLQLSPFLSALNDATSGYSLLPSNVRYVFLAGHYQLSDEHPFFDFPALSDDQGEILGDRHNLCPVFEENPPTDQALYTDGIVPIRSADPLMDMPKAFFNVAQSRLFAKHTAKAHWEETEDIPTILCALSSNCLVAEAHSPVDLQLIAPDGTQIAPDLTEIAGAGYEVIHDSNQHESAVVTIPFPIAGTYRVVPIPKADAQPFDMYSISVTQNGTTRWLAQNVAVAAAPPTGYTVTANAAPVAKIAGPANVVATGPSGALVTLLGSAVDPDGDVVSLRWMGTFGDVAGPALTTTLPVGTNRVVLVATDSHGATGTAQTLITVSPQPPFVSFSGAVQQPLIGDGKGHFIATVAITNQGNTTVSSAQISGGTALGGASLLSSSGPISGLAPGASATVTLTFPITSALASATSAPLKINGIYSAGTLTGNWGLSFRSVSLK